MEDKKVFCKEDLEQAETMGAIKERLKDIFDRFERFDDRWDEKFKLLHSQQNAIVEQLKDMYDEKADRKDLLELEDKFEEHKEKTTGILKYGMGILATVTFLLGFFKDQIINIFIK